MVLFYGLLESGLLGFCGVDVILIELGEIFSESSINSNNVRNKGNNDNRAPRRVNNNKDEGDVGIRRGFNQL